MAIAEHEGQLYQLPDDIKDSEVPAAVSRLRYQKNPSLNNMARLLLAGTQTIQQQTQPQAQPQTTLPNISGGNVAFLGRQGTENLIQNVQKSKETAMQQQMREREATAIGIQKEKDRQNRINLQDMKYKNDLKEAEFKAKLTAERDQNLSDIRIQESDFLGKTELNMSRADLLKIQAEKTLAEAMNIPQPEEEAARRQAELRQINARTESYGRANQPKPYKPTIQKVDENTYIVDGQVMSKEEYYNKYGVHPKPKPPSASTQSAIERSARERVKVMNETTQEAYNNARSAAMLNGTAPPEAPTPYTFDDGMRDARIAYGQDVVKTIDDVKRLGLYEGDVVVSDEGIGYKIEGFDASGEPQGSSLPYNYSKYATKPKQSPRSQESSPSKGAEKSTSTTQEDVVTTPDGLTWKKLPNGTYEQQ